MGGPRAIPEDVTIQGGAVSQAQVRTEPERGRLPAHGAGGLGGASNQPWVPSTVALGPQAVTEPAESSASCEQGCGGHLRCESRWRAV